MPDKYMREIEEILRNIERTEPRHDQGERIRPFARPPSRRRRGFSLPHLEPAVALILLGILLTLAGAALAYYQADPVALRTGGTYGTLASGVVAAAGFALFLAGLIVAWWARFHGVSSSPARSLRRPPARDNRDNVVRIRPARSNPFSRLMTSLRMRRMRRRYRNFSDH